MRPIQPDGVDLGRRLDSRSSAPPSLDAAAAGSLVVDARALSASGVGRYVRELLGAWLTDPPFGSLVLLGDAEELRALAAGTLGADRTTIVAHRGGFYSPTAQLSWIRLCAANPEIRRARAAFFPHWDAPIVAMPRRSLVTVHDLTHFLLPDAFPRHKRVVAARMFRRVVHTAARIACGSETTAADLARARPDAARKTVVIPYGVTERFRAWTSPATLDGPYLLCVGNQKPHKNLVAAARVLARVHALGRQDVRLAVVGRRFGDGGSIAEAIRGLGIGSAVRELGEVDDAMLHALYAGCVAFLFPSRYEGFGLPVVEAMAAGAPVVASSAPAVAEAVSGAAPVFDPDDVNGMAEEVIRLATAPELRADRVSRGRARAATLSWGACAAETARVLRSLSADASADTAGPLARGAVAPVN